MRFFTLLMVASLSIIAMGCSGSTESRPNTAGVSRPSGLKAATDEEVKTFFSFAEMVLVAQAAVADDSSNLTAIVNDIRSYAPRGPMADATDFRNSVRLALANCRVRKLSEPSLAGASTLQVTRWADSADAQRVCGVNFSAVSRTARSNVAGQGQVGKWSADFSLNFAPSEKEFAPSALMGLSYSTGGEGFERSLSESEKWKTSVIKGQTRQSGKVSTKEGSSFTFEISNESSLEGRFLDDSERTQTGTVRTVGVFNLPTGIVVYEKVVEYQRFNKVTTTIYLNSEKIFETPKTL